MKMIPSGELWLGEVPADWTRSRIRNVATLSPGYSVKAPFHDELCTVVPMENVSEDGAIDVSNLLAFEDISSGLTLFEQGDVLFAKITPCMENGKGAYVATIPTQYAFGSTEFHVLRPSPQVDGKFLYYATFNPVYRAYAAENMTGAAGQKRVSSRFLKDTRIFLPSITEQRIIATYLDATSKIINKVVSSDKKTGEITKTTGLLNRQISTLTNYRKSLIHECVTGQRRITEQDLHNLQERMTFDD